MQKLQSKTDMDGCYLSMKEALLTMCLPQYMYQMIIPCTREQKFLI